MNRFFLSYALHVLAEMLPLLERKLEQHRYFFMIKTKKANKRSQSLFILGASFCVKQQFLRVNLAVVMSILCSFSLSIMFMFLSFAGIC